MNIPRVCRTSSLKALFATAALAVSGFFFIIALTGCAAEEEREAVGMARVNVTNAAEVAAGGAARQVSGPSQTVLPDGERTLFDYEYWFKPVGGREPASPAEPTSGGNTFSLPPGQYTVRVKAFLKGSGGSTPTYKGIDTVNEAAWGDSEPFTVTANLLKDGVTVALIPFLSTDGGTGFFAYSITRPVGTTITTLSLTSFSDGVERVYTADSDTSGDSGGDVILREASKSGIPCGYYTLVVLLADANGRTTGGLEVVHIFNTLTTEVSFEFTAVDFKDTKVVEGTVRVGLTFWDLEDDSLDMEMSGAVLDKYTNPEPLTAVVPATHTFVSWLIDGRPAEEFPGVRVDRSTHTITLTTDMPVKDNYRLVLTATKIVTGEEVLYSRRTLFSVRDGGCTVTLYGGSLSANIWDGEKFVGSQLTVRRPYGETFGDVLNSVSVLEGYVFTGWWTQVTSQGQTFGDIMTPADIVTGDIGLYAGLEARSCDVILDANGGTIWDGEADVEVLFTTRLYLALYGDILDTIPVREGYIFTGWWTQATSEGEVTGTKVEAKNYVLDDIILYAGWVMVPIPPPPPTPCEVTLDANGGVIWDGKQAVSTVSVTRYYDDAYGDILNRIPTLEGYAFTGWWTERDGEGAAIGTVVKPEDIVTGDITLYAGWTRICTITFDSRGGTPALTTRKLNLGETYGELPVASRTGYELIGWYTGILSGVRVTPEDTVTGDITFYAHWTPTICTITLNANGGIFKDGENYVLSVSGIKSYGERYGDILETNIPIRETDYFNSWYMLYLFDGWYTASYGGRQITAEDIVSGDITLYAQWTERQVLLVNVTFNSNGGVTPSPASKEVTVGEAYGELPTSTRSGCTFKGWYTAASGGTAVTAETIVTQTTSHTLYAHWVAAGITASPSNIKFWNAWVEGSEMYKSLPQSIDVTISSSIAGVERPALTRSTENHPWVHVDLYPDQPTVRIYLKNWSVYRGGGEAAIQSFRVTIYAGSASTTITGEIWGTIDGKPTY